MRSHLRLVEDGDGVDGDFRVADTRVDGGSRRIRLRHILLVDLVHRGEVCEVGQEYLDLDDILPAGPGRAQQGRDVVEDLTRLVGEIVRDDGAGGRIEGPLCGYVERWA